MQPEADKWGWKHVSVFGEFDKGSGTKRWKCNHCNLRYNGSYSRVRAHLLGSTGVGVKSCPAIDPSLKETFQVLEEERSSARKSKGTPGTQRPRKRPRASSTQPISALSMATASKEEVDDAVARFVFANGLDPRVVNSPYFREMVRAVASHGHRYRPPSPDEISNSFLAKEKARLDRSLAQIRESWPHTGCSLLCVGRAHDADGPGSLRIDVFASSPRGLVFLKSFDADESDEDGPESRLAGRLRGAVEEVGPANVVQIITRTISDVAELRKSFPRVFVSRCASRSVEILMDGIAEAEWVKAVAGCAADVERCVSKFRSSDPDAFPHDLRSAAAVGPTALPFFGVVRRVLELRQPLEEAVRSEKWREWKLKAPPEDVSDGEAAILEDTFWGTAELLVQIVGPLARLNGVEGSSAGAGAGEMCNWRARAVEEVREKGLRGVRASQFEELVERMWDPLFSPIHSASYVLNPRFFGRGQAKDKLAMRGWKAALERYEPESSGRRVLREQLSSYWRAEGSFGDEDAVDCRDKMDPVAWWENFGFDAPHLQTMAIKVLSQVSSVAVCEEVCREPGVRQRLGPERDEDFVFVQNNLRINGQKNAARVVANPVLFLE